MNRCDIMNLFLLGYLCFCVAINPTESSDLDTRDEISDRYDNCTQCELKWKSCICLERVDECLICCPDVPCCACYDCSLCWYRQRRVMLMTQISISIMFGFGVIGLIVVYCKICHRAREALVQSRRGRRVALQEHRDLTRCSIIEGLQERPPSYNEVVRSDPPSYTSSCNSAPPLYTSPYNKTSMQEAPPSYPGTPKPQERSRGSDEPVSPSVAQHI